MGRQHEDAIAALEGRIIELRVRLDHARMIDDTEKITSLERKLARAMARMKRLRRKAMGARRQSP